MAALLLRREHALGNQVGFAVSCLADLSVAWFFVVCLSFTQADHDDAPGRLPGDQYAGAVQL